MRLARTAIVHSPLAVFAASPVGSRILNEAPKGRSKKLLMPGINRLEVHEVASDLEERPAGEGNPRGGIAVG